MSFYDKYLKYKSKYLNLKNSVGGGDKFIDAVKSHDYELVERKLTEKHGLVNSHYADCNQLECKTGYTPFVIAWNNRDLKMGELLIKYGADVNIANLHTKLPPILEVITLIADYKLDDDSSLATLQSRILDDGKLVELLKWVEIILTAGGSLMATGLKQSKTQLLQVDVSKINKIQLDIFYKGFKNTLSFFKALKNYPHVIFVKYPSEEKIFFNVTDKLIESVSIEIENLRYWMR